MSTEVELVAEVYPPLPAVEPVRARSIHWLFAIPAAAFALIFPRRMGPHLAASSWKSALLVQALSVLWAFGTLLSFAIDDLRFSVGGAPPSPAESDLLDEIRRPFAAIALVAYEQIDAWTRVFIVCAAAGLLQAGVFVAAAMLMPFYAAGETRSALYRRCAKLLLWSHAGLIVLAHLLVGILRTNDQARISHDEAVGVVLTAWGVWWMTVLLRLGGRYGGPKDGPGWQPRPIVCEHCGYELTMQTMHGRCAECGADVADSLPERRSPTPFAAARGLAKIPAFFRTLWLTLSARRFARTYTVLSGHRAARQFALCVALLSGAAAMISLAPVPGSLGFLIGADPFRLSNATGVSAALNLAMIGFIGALMAGSALLIMGFVTIGCGWLNPYRRGIVVCYSSGWLAMIMFLGCIGANFSDLVDDAHWLVGAITIPVLGSIDYQSIAQTALMAPAGITTLLWGVELRHMLSLTRNANA